jgi:NAD dependent epimerase/dehydratase family enzyme
MRIAITGASGLVGTALVPFLQGGGHDVIRLVRAAPRSSGEHQWTPDRGIVDVAALGPVDAVVHLAGENIAGARWSPAVRRACGTAVRDRPGHSRSRSPPHP